MKIITYLFLFAFLFFLKNIKSQTIFWHEGFGLGCNQGSLANTSVPTPTNGAWSVANMGAQGVQCNEWFISSTEAGMPIGQCGDGCIANSGLTNKTLHIGSNLASPNLDPGAIYLQNGASNTDKRIQSPVIDCSQRNDVVLSFNYITNGVPNSDFAEVVYLANGGTNWSNIDILSPSIGTCSPKGLWASKSYTLPASANGNANVKIGFRWRNDNSLGSGNLSVAIDEITLSGVLNTGVSQQVNNKLNIKAYPNPFTNKINIELSGELNVSNSSISIFNTLCQQVFQTGKPMSKQEIDLSFLASGIYYLKAQNNLGHRVFKIIKE